MAADRLAGCLKVGVVGRAYHRTAGHVRESTGACDRGQLVEFLRRQIAIDREVKTAGLQILSQREHLTSVVAQMLHDRFDLGRLFAEAQHQSGLGGYVGTICLEIPE